MAENTKIEWATHTFNPWVGCTKVSAACDGCYAEAWAKRTGHPELWQGERRRTSAANWREPIKWDKAAAAAGERHRVFCASLADVFDNQVPVEWRYELWQLIVKTPHLDWLLLTKRPQNIRKMLPSDWEGGLENVWLGTTAEDQEQYDLRWGHLRKIPAVVRFISYEPALGPMLPGMDKHEGETPDWIIAGGESGPKARPAHPQWFRDLRDDCGKLGIAFFVKQWGEWRPITFKDLASEEIESEEPAGRISGFRDQPMHRVGKKLAGRLLDGIEHNEFPAEKV